MPLINVDKEGPSCELITIGNELLSGRTLNTNAQWLADILTDLGGTVLRCTVVRDDLADISSSIKESMQRGTSCIITSGGLGPTYDDITLEGLALATRRELYVNKVALRQLEQRYNSMKKKGLIADSTISPSRMKMAKIPIGAKPLENPLGSAPGVLLSYETSTIICLPGVPDEMKAIMLRHVVPTLKRKFPKFYRLEATLQISGITESILAPLLDIVLGKVKNVYLKSHPMGFEDGISKIDIEIISSSLIRNSAKKSIDLASLALRRGIKEKGGQIIRVVNDSNT